MIFSANIITKNHFHRAKLSMNGCSKYLVAINIECNCSGHQVHRIVSNMIKKYQNRNGTPLFTIEFIQTFQANRFSFNCARFFCAIIQGFLKQIRWLNNDIELVYFISIVIVRPLTLDRNRKKIFWKLFNWIISIRLDLCFDSFDSFESHRFHFLFLFDIFRLMSHVHID